MQTIISNLTGRKARYMADYLSRKHYRVTIRQVKDSLFDEHYIKSNAPMDALNNASSTYDRMIVETI